MNTIVMTRKLDDEKYDFAGKRSMVMGYRANKGQVFVVAVLGIMEPSQVTPKFIKSELQFLAKEEVFIEDASGKQLTPKEVAAKRKQAVAESAPKKKPKASRA